MNETVIGVCFSLFNFSHFLHFTVGFSFKLLFEDSNFVTFWLCPAGFQEWHEFCLDFNADLFPIQEVS
jgi:hypothetical protein